LGTGWAHLSGHVVAAAVTQRATHLGGVRVGVRLRLRLTVSGGKEMR